MGAAFTYLRKVSARLFKSRYVKLIVPIEMLREAGDVLPDDAICRACAEIAKEAARHRGLFLPKYRVEYIGSEESPQHANYACNDTSSDEHNTKDLVVPGVTCHDPAGANLGLEGVVHPLSYADGRDSSRDDRAILPITGDASQQRGGGNASNGMPPVKILSDSGNLHPVNPTQPER